jgi:hypothetical protein
VPSSDLVLEEQPHLVALADIDGDRDLDLIASSHDSAAIWIWRGSGNGHFAQGAKVPAMLTTKRPHNHGLVVGDLDRDGDADVIVADQTARAIAVLLADGKGGFAAPVRIELAGQPYPPALGDVDGDGRLDLVVPLLDRQAIAILLGDGRGGFRNAAGSPVPTVHPRPYGIAIGDLDRDGTADVIVSQDDTDEISILLGDGRGGMRAAPSSPINAGRRIGSRLAAVDVDHDGALDLVGAGSGSLVVMRGDGHGGFAQPEVEACGGWSAVATDVDGNGTIDVIAPEPSAGVVRIWRGR